MEKKKSNKTTLAIILAVIIILAVLWIVIGGSKKTQKTEPDVPTTPTLNIPVEEQSDEPYPYDDLSVLYGIWKATGTDFIKDGQKVHADFEEDDEYYDLSEVYLLFKEDYIVYLYDGYAEYARDKYENGLPSYTYEAEMMKEFDGQVNVVVFDNDSYENEVILRRFALDHQTKVLTWVHRYDEEVGDIYFKKISSSTDESVFQ